MFYAHFVLSKKGPLAKIWLAAHWDKKLTKAHIFETDIENSVEAIIQPKVKLALRTSGHLLLGVVRIYSRKAKYLLADCNEALVKIKMAFRPGMIDLPEENREVAVAAITFPENFCDFEEVMADMVDFELPTHDVNQCRPEEITIREEFGQKSFHGDDDFGEIGFDSFVMPDVQLDDPLYVTSVRPVPEYDAESPAPLEMEMEDSREPCQELPMDVVNEEDDREGETVHSNGVQANVTAPYELVQSPKNFVATEDVSDFEGPAGAEDDSDDSDHEGFGTTADPGLFDDDMARTTERLFEEPESVMETAQPVSSVIDEYDHPADDDATTVPKQTTLTGVDQTTLITNESEAFALMPIDVTNVGTERKAKKKRKLIIDEQKTISSEAMKHQLAGGSDLIRPLDLAPPTKKLMQWKELGGIDRLLVLPGRRIISKKLLKLYTDNLISRPSVENDEVAEQVPTQKRKPKESAKIDARRESEEIETHRQETSLNSTSRAGVRSKTFPADGSLDLSESLPIEAMPQPSAEKRPRMSFMSESLQSTSFRADDTFVNSSLPVVELPQEPTINKDAINSFDDMNVTHQLSPSVEDGLRTPRAVESETSFLPTVTVESSFMCPGTPGAAMDQANISLLQPQSNFSVSMIGDDNADDSIFDETVSAANNANQFMDEEDEAEGIINKRSSEMLKILRRTLKSRSSIGTKELFANDKRKKVASKFYTLLVLKKMNVVNLHQEEPFGDITITVSQ